MTTKRKIARNYPLQKLFCSFHIVIKGPVHKFHCGNTAVSQLLKFSERRPDTFRSYFLIVAGKAIRAAVRTTSYALDINEPSAKISPLCKLRAVRISQSFKLFSGQFFAAVSPFGGSLKENVLAKPYKCLFTLAPYNTVGKRVSSKNASPS